MSEIIPGTANNLPDWLAFLGVSDCQCSWEWKALGTLHLMSLGKGWVRTSTNPQCRHHAGPVGPAGYPGAAESGRAADAERRQG